jgi:ribosomal protein S18 acetylase RimI-like enzyme
VRLTTKELSKRTWPDYSRFFSQGNGWDHCACTAYQGVRSRSGSFADQRDANLATKCNLLERALAHGILVYAEGEPVGWCQFGPINELPIPRKAKPLPDDVAQNAWRITCFCTMKDYREQGVAELALRAALDSIRKRGGGLVTAHPVVGLPHDQRLDELIREYGGVSTKVLRHAKKRFGATDVVAYDRRAWSVGGVFVHGLGPVWASVRRGASASHTGSMGMFERERFRATGVIEPTSRKLPLSRVVMQRTVRGS